MIDVYNNAVCLFIHRHDIINKVDLNNIQKPMKQSISFIIYSVCESLCEPAVLNSLYSQRRFVEAQCYIQIFKRNQLIIDYIYNKH